MGWSHPDISLEDLLHLIKGFIDILILSSGYQSSGLPALWDAENIKKAIRWGLFFEDVFRRLHEHGSYQDSVKELDSALLELTANPYFPQGLVHLSSATLCRAREFVVQHLLQTLPLKDAHLSALLTAIIEMDLDDLNTTKYDSLNIYVDKLMLHMASLNLIQAKNDFIKSTQISSSAVHFLSEDQVLHDTAGNLDGIGSDMNPGYPVVKTQTGDNSSIVIRELLKRQVVVSRVSSVQRGLDAVSEIVAKCDLAGSFSTPLEARSHTSIPLVNKEGMGSSQWRARNLYYLLDKRTIRLVSGAKLIFSAPKVQWLRVLETLKASNESRNDSLPEIIELLLLGLISSRWNCVIQHFISVSSDLLPVSKQYYDLCDLLHERSKHLHSKELTLNSMGHDILKYLRELLTTQTHKLWKLNPVLAAAAIPSWSILFQSYLSEIERQIRGDSSTISCCTCIEEGKDHKECEIAERIWCLYIFHIQGSHPMID